MKKRPSLLQSLVPLLFMILSLAIGYGYLGLQIEPLLILSGFVAGAVALFLGYSWDEMLESMITGVVRTLPPILILWSVGFLIGSWMFSGTIAMMIYYGLQLINPHFLLVTAFFITAIISISTGTSFGSVGTVGVAIMGIAQGLGMPQPIVAGAILSGAYFGDKLSPFSDTTNIASLAAGSDLYEHIRHMLYTTIPSTIIAVTLYIIIGLYLDPSSNVNTQSTHQLLDQLNHMFHWNILLILPVFLIVYGSIRKWPAIPTMLGTAFFAILLGVFIQNFSLQDGFTAAVKGFNTNMIHSDIEIIPVITKLLNRGGIIAMLPLTVLLFCAMGFAGIMNVTGMLDTVLHAILKVVKSAVSLVMATMLSCVTMAFVTGSTQLTVLIPGELFRNAYIQKGFFPKNLSRTLEDSGTMVMPLIPWTAAGAYMSATLGISTFEYLPWAFLNYTGMIIAIILAVTGFGFPKLNSSEKEALMKKFEIEEASK